MFWVKWLAKVDEIHGAVIRTREITAKIMNAVAENGRLSKESVKNSTDALATAETMLAELRAGQEGMARQAQAFMFTVGLMAVRTYEADGMTPATRLLLEKAVTALEGTEAAAPLSPGDGELLGRLRRLAQPQEPAPPPSDAEPGSTPAASE